MICVVTNYSQNFLCIQGPSVSLSSGTVTTLTYNASGLSIPANNGISAQPIRTIFCGFEGFHWFPKWSECVSCVQTLFLYLPTIVSANYCEICAHIHVLRLKRFFVRSLRKPLVAFREGGGGEGGAVKEDGLRCTGPFTQNVTDVFHKLAGLGLLWKLFLRWSFVYITMLIRPQKLRRFE